MSRFHDVEARTMWVVERREWSDVVGKFPGSSKQVVGVSFVGILKKAEKPSGLSVEKCGDATGER